MALPRTYPKGNGSLARALEVVGERWTLLIIRDAFYGARRFGDFAAQPGIPRSVLASRLKSLVQEGVLTRNRDTPGTVEYRLTERGMALWPALRALMHWGDECYSPAGAKHVLRHDTDGGLVDQENRCLKCRAHIQVSDIRIERGPGFEPTGPGQHPASVRMHQPRRLVEPINVPPTVEQ